MCVFFVFQLEAKFTTLQTELDQVTSRGQEEMTNLCREFANEKTELVKKNETEVGISLVVMRVLHP